MPVGRMRLHGWILGLLTGCAEPGSSSSEDTDPALSTEETLPIEPGEYRLALTDGREFVVHLPETFDSSISTPILFVFHGANQGARYAWNTFKIQEATDERGWILIFGEGSNGGYDPVGPKSGRTWNVEYCCGQASRMGVDDLAYFDAILEVVGRDYSVDRTRVYATGFSNGAMLTHRLAAERSEELAAVAPIAGCAGGWLDGEFWAPAPPSLPVPLVEVHGRSDGTVPFEGDEHFESVAQTMAFWSTANQCQGDPVVLATGEPHVVVSTMTDCAGGAEVWQVAVEGGTHKYNLLEEFGANTPEQVAQFLERFTRE